MALSKSTVTPFGLVASYWRINDMLKKRIQGEKAFTVSVVMGLYQSRTAANTSGTIPLEVANFTLSEPITEEELKQEGISDADIIYVRLREGRYLKGSWETNFWADADSVLEEGQVPLI